MIVHPPPVPLLTKVTETISTGEPVPLHDEVVDVLAAKRLRETTK